MGTPKLLLPIEGQPLVGHTLAAWRQSQVERIIVVLRRSDDALADLIRVRAAADPRIELVVPAVPPPDMRASIQAALAHLAASHQPGHRDAFLVAPADMPRLSAPIINRLIQWHGSAVETAVLVPLLAGRRGHPVLFPWPLAGNVQRLGPEEGLNVLVERGRRKLVPCDDLAPASGLAANVGSPFDDIDTPADYDRLTAR